MDWQSQLIDTYLSVCLHWKQGVWTSVQRFSNHKEYKITDEEISTIYLYGIISGRTNLREIYDYTNNHMKEWFPQLKGYSSFVHRINQISDAFIFLTELLSEQLNRKFINNSNTKLIDSMPIVMANGKRSSAAKVAPQLADKGYCDSKKMYYYGVKVHILGSDRDSTLPLPDKIGMTPASNHDLTTFRHLKSELFNCDIFCDKAYGDKELQKDLKEKSNVVLSTPIKLKKGENLLDSSDKIYSTMVSRIRQPIESLFNWLNEKTGIQKASKVRSDRGLIVHIFGKIAAGLIMLTF